MHIRRSFIRGFSSCAHACAFTTAALGALTIATSCSAPDASTPTEAIGTQTSALSSASTAHGRTAYHRSPHASASRNTSSLPADPAVSGAPAGPIGYHGGPVMKGTVKIYSIFYGNFPSATADTPQDPGQPGAASWQEYIGGFVNLLSNSTYMHINQTYPGADNVPATESLSWETTTWDTSYSQGKFLTKTAIETLIAGAIDDGTFPVDPNAIYMIFGGADVSEGDDLDEQCHTFCGWHTSASAQSISIGGADLKFAFISDPEACPAAFPCTRINFNTPSGNVNLDAIISETAHEIEETLTDPDITAYYTHGTTSMGNEGNWENEDRCAYEYGNLFSITQYGNTFKANMSLSGYYYLVQENWVNTNPGFCGMFHLNPSGITAWQQGLSVAQATRNGVKVTLGAIAAGADGAVYVRGSSNGTWTAPTALSAASFAPATAGVAIGQQSSTTIDGFLVGSDGKVYVTKQTNGGAWSALSPITAANFAMPGALVTTGTPGGQLAVFVVDTTGKLEMIAYNPILGWQAPQALTAASFAPSGAALAVGTRASGEFDVFAVGTDGALKYVFFNLNIWGGPLVLTSTNFAPAGAPIGVARDVHGFLNVMTVGNDGALYTDWDVTPAWSGPTALTATAYASPGGVVAAVNNRNAALYAFLVDKTGSVQALSNAGFGWSTTLVAANATTPGASVSAALQGTSEIDLFIGSNSTPSGMLESTSTGGAWSVPTPLP